MSRDASCNPESFISDAGAIQVEPDAKTIPLVIIKEKLPTARRKKKEVVHRGPMKAPRIVFRGTHKKGISSVAVISAPTKRTVIASGGNEKLITLWSLKSGHKIAALSAHESKITDLSVYQDKHGHIFLVSVSWDSLVKIWPANCCFEEGISAKTIKAQMQEKVITLSGHKNRIYSVDTLRVPSADDDVWIATGSADSTVHIWSATHQHVLFKIFDREPTWFYNVQLLMLSRHNNNVNKLNGGKDKKSAEKQLVAAMDGIDTSDKEGGSTIDANSPLLVAGCKDGTVRIWDLKPEEANLSVDNKMDHVSSTKVHGTQTKRLSSAMNAITSRLLVNRETSVVHDDEAGEALQYSIPRRVDRSHTSSILKLHAFESPFDGWVYVTLCKDKLVRITNLRKGTLIRTIEPFRAYSAVSLHVCHCPKFKMDIVITGGPKGGIRVWNMQTTELIRILNGHNDSTDCLTAFPAPIDDDDDKSRDKRASPAAVAAAASRDVVIVSGSLNSTVRTWLFAEEKLFHKLDMRSMTKGKRIRVLCLAVIAAEQKNPWIVVCCENAVVYAFKIKRTTRELKQCCWEYQSHSTVKSLAIYEPPFYAEDDEEEDDHLQHDVVDEGCVGNTERIISSMNIPKLVESKTGDHIKFLVNYSKPFVLTGCKNGDIRASLLYGTEDVDGKWISGGTPIGGLWSKAHDACITALKIFSGWSPTDETHKEWLKPFVVSASEDRTLKIWSLAAESFGSNLSVLSGHEFDVTSMSILFPLKQKEAELKRVAKDKEDDNTSVGSRSNNNNSSIRRRRNGSKNGQSEMTSGSRRGGGGGASRLSLHSFGGSVLDEDEDEDAAADISLDWDFVIASGSMDNTVRLWGYNPLESDSEAYELVVLQGPRGAQIGSVATIEMNYPRGPMVIAGATNGDICVWSMLVGSSYRLLATLRGHSDEVLSLAVYEKDGINPVLASGCFDMTVRVWSLKKLELIKTVEGHKAEVNSVCMFSPGGTDAALISGSSDSTIRLTFNFLSSVPSPEAIRKAYYFDLEDRNSHVYGEEGCVGIGGMDAQKVRWPRMTVLINQSGPELFFSSPAQYMYLYTSIENHRIDFLEKFLPQSKNALVNSNNFLHAHNGRKYPSLLQFAIDKEDSAAVEVIVSAWASFYSCVNRYTYMKEALLSQETLLNLAEAYPLQFERLICSITYLPAQNNRLPRGLKYFYSEEDDRIQSNSDCESSSDEDDVDSGIASQISRIARGAAQIIPGDGESDGTSVTAGGEDRFKTKYMWLPICSPYDLKFIKHMGKVCDRLDSVELFDSDVGKMALKFAWERRGKPVHVRAFLFYVAYLFVFSFTLYAYKSMWQDDSIIHAPYAAVGLCILNIFVNIYFIVEETNQMMGEGAIEYLSDVWNQIDITIIFCTGIGMLLRVAFRGETDLSRAFLALSCVGVWFNVLYYLRAFETTGPLVSMIFKIAKDMRAFIMVLFISLIGFSQAFWVVTYEDNGSSSLFNKIDTALLQSYNFALGNFDPLEFAGARMVHFAIFLSCVYMLVMGILLLNLLIALMGDSYAVVQARGLAQWRLEQSQLMIELLGLAVRDTKNANSADSYNKIDPAGVENMDKGADFPSGWSSSPLVGLPNKVHPTTAAANSKSKLQGGAGNTVNMNLAAGRNESRENADLMEEDNVPAPAAGTAAASNETVISAAAPAHQQHEEHLKSSSAPLLSDKEEELYSATMQIFVRCTEKSALNMNRSLAQIVDNARGGGGVGESSTAGIGGGGISSINSSSHSGIKQSATAYSGNINESMTQLESKLMTEITALKELIISNSSSQK